MDGKIALYNNKGLFNKMNEGGGLSEDTFKEVVDEIYRAGWEECERMAIESFTQQLRRARKA
jgi:hypothetical protein